MIQTQSPLGPRLPPLRLRSTRLRERRAFHRANINQNLDHQTQFHYLHRQQQTQQEQGEPAHSVNTAREERLPRRANYPGYATYRYRDQIARQQEKWSRSGKERSSNGLTKRDGYASLFRAPEGHDGEDVAEKLPVPNTKGKKGKGTKKTETSQSSISQERIASPSGGRTKQANCRTRVTGADIYVVRMTRSGAVGNATPCWRCMEWCKWAGVKRIFHYAVDDDGTGGIGEDVGNGKQNKKGRWVCVKVNDSTPEKCYWTQGDGRILGGNDN